MTEHSREAGRGDEMDLDAIKADLEYASSGIDGGDQQYHPHALTAMRAAEKLLDEVERLEQLKGVHMELIRSAAEQRADLQAKLAEAQRDAEQMRLVLAAHGQGVDPNGYYAGTPGWRLRRGRSELKAAIHPALHDLDVRINGLNVGACHCNLVAEVVLDAIHAVDALAAEQSSGEPQLTQTGEQPGGYTPTDAELIADYEKANGELTRQLLALEAQRDQVLAAIPLADDADDLAERVRAIYADSREAPTNTQTWEHERRCNQLFDHLDLGMMQCIKRRRHDGPHENGSVTWTMTDHRDPDSRAGQAGGEVTG